MPHRDGHDMVEAPKWRRETGPDGPLDGGRCTDPPFVAEARVHAADPVIARFRAALASVQTAELERLYDRLPELDEHSRQAIHEFADCLVANMLHPPLESLCNESRDGNPRGLLSALQRLFRLDD